MSDHACGSRWSSCRHVPSVKRPPVETLPVGTRVWKIGSGNGAQARFGDVVVVPTCFICDYFAEPRRGPTPAHGHSFSVCFGDGVWEIVDVSDVEAVTASREARIRCPGPSPGTRVS